MPQIPLWLIVLGCGFGLLFLQVAAASYDKMLSPEQMLKTGTEEGLPFVAHGGMWGDAFLTPWFAYLTMRYSAGWSHDAVMLAGIAAFFATLAMHWVYTLGTIREAHVKDHKLTAAGTFHFLFMWGAFTLLVLYYAAAQNPDPRLMWWTTLILAIHVALGNHFMLGLFAPEWYPGKPLQSPVGWISVIGTAVLLSAWSYLRVGLPN